MSGTLYICGTPIGNLEDITIRCLNTLKEVDFIAAEDTRHTLKLLNHYNIKMKTPLISYHEHNKHTKGKYIIHLLEREKNVALVSDAGMPGISDPGEDLIKLCYEFNINVTAVPGPTAVITGLVLSGLNTKRYVFEAFLPTNKKQREFHIKKMKHENKTTVLYEAPHHLISTLEEIYNCLGERKISVIREITKKHETVNQGNIKDIIQYFKDNEPKGEFVIVIEGISYNNLIESEQKKWSEININEHVNIYIEKGYTKKDAMKMAAKDRGISKREIYAYLNKNEKF